VVKFYRDRLGLDYGVESTLIAGGSRPIIFAAFAAIVDPGDKVVYPIPSWNNNHYTYLTGGVPVEIVASDISDRCLERARQGLFTQFEVQRGLPIQMLMQHFTQQDDHWRISERLRQQVTFKKQNLIDATTYSLGKFDVVLCRNVLTFFDGPTKGEVLDRMAQQLNSGGFLILGAAESVIGLSTSFEATQDRRGLYKLTARNVKAA